MLSQVMPQTLALHWAEALVTFIVQGADAFEMKRQPFESALHVSISVPLVHT